MRLAPRSIRVRLTLWYAGALAGTLALFSIAIYSSVRSNLLHELKERAEQGSALIRHSIADGAQEADELEQHDIVQLFAIVRPGVPIHTSGAWTRQGLPDPLQAAAQPGARAFESDRGEQYLIVNSSSVDPAGPATILVAVDAGEVLAHLRTLAWTLALGLAGSIAVAIAGGLFLARRALAPVGAMASAARQITAERLSDRLPIERADDEFGRLATAFNQTLARLEDAFERLHRFTADASHELRTPLTALRSVGEVALQDPQFHTHCRETIVSMLEESERLTQLVDGLLVLTRESTEVYRSRFAAVDLGLMANEVAELFRALAEEQDQRIDVQSEAALIVHGDRTTLRQALLNLVDNAIKFTPRGGRVRVRAATNGAREAIVEVTDDGPGIAEEHRERVFDRFYRIETDRSRLTGGTGLGLAIARWATELNGGRIELTSTPGRGSTFRIHLPKSTVVALPSELASVAQSGV